ncbi:reverse transcriptase domain-containing protein [Tanacetum coccineum]
MITDGQKRQKTPSKNSKNDPGPTGSYNSTFEGNLIYIPSGIRGSSQCSAIGSKERITTSDTLRLVLISPTKTEYTYALRLKFESTNNQAKYDALLEGLRIAKKMGVRSLFVNVDSKLMASQINVAFNYLTKEILVETLDTPSMDIEEINPIVKEEGETWMTPIINYLERGIWPEEKNETRALRMKIVGNGCLGTAPRSPRKGEVRNCGHRLFHKMDRSQTADQDDREGGKEVRMG